MAAYCIPILGLVAVGGSAAAQSPDVEMGIDAGVTISIPDDGDNTTTVDVPFGRFRFGTYASDRTLVELGLGFRLIDVSGETVSSGNGEVSVSYHFTGDATHARAYLIVGGGGRFVHVDDDTTGQGFVLGGLGVKLPIRRVVGIRLETDYLRTFETSRLDAAHELRFLIGTSFYLGG
jgi:hypothetical protein